MLSATTPFAGLLSPSGSSGVSVVERNDLGLATVQARKGRVSDVARHVQSGFGLELATGPRRAGANGVAFAGIGPTTWLASSEGGGNAFAAALSQSLGDAASVVDQSDGFAVLCMTGPRVRDLLARLVPIDMHERSFKVGDVASSVAGHVGVTVWRVEDAADGSPTFEIALYRSFAVGFARMVDEIIGGLALSA